jgi:cyclopropane-fatty-acyl-phospholipid synthase
MNSRTDSSRSGALQGGAAPFDLARPARMPLAARSVLAMLRKLRYGRLELRLPDGSVLSLGGAQRDQALAQVQVSDWSVFGAVLRRGDIGFAEGYMSGQWATTDLPGLLGLLAANRAALERALHGSPLGTLADRLRHALLRRNTRRGSRDNIHAHYDLGNDFYRLWLDPGMNYSSALFTEPGMGLEQAQQAKLDRVLRELQPRPGQRVVELGCGWGGFAETAARAGLEVDGITLSDRQLEFARARLRDAGLDGRARVHLCDYRDARRLSPAGGFDALASIEMFEAVGEAYWPDYFRTVAELLRPGGRACIQSIVIDEALFPAYRRGTDFIQRYVFPGGMLPSRRAFVEQARAAGLEVLGTHAFGLDYASTLAMWRERFLARLAAVREQGFDRRFERLWDFYLAYCEAGFAHGSIDVVQFTLRRPG